MSCFKHKLSVNVIIANDVVSFSKVFFMKTIKKMQTMFIPVCFIA